MVRLNCHGISISTHPSPVYSSFHKKSFNSYREEDFVVTFHQIFGGCTSEDLPYASKLFGLYNIEIDR